MRTQTKVAMVIATVVVVGVASFFIAGRGSQDEGTAAVSSAAEESAIVRADSRVLGEDGQSDVTFVEFLDFECEACGAAYPIVEALREKYAGDVTFVIRYFPLPGHFNSERAARAVESAARQGKLEEMYSKMYETQDSWGEADTPHDDLFRSFAEDIGLDMTQYDADYASDEVADRVARDVADGETLGVQGTPTFYVDGELFQPRTVDDFSTVLNEALAE